MKIYYEDDANIEIIQNMNVTIVGYGSQGHAHANNLHESGVDVTVALREGSSSWKKAEEAGLKVSSVSESVKDADLVIWDADKKFTYGKNDLHDNVGYNPYEGRNIVGWPEMVISRGDVIVENETISHDYGRGTRMHIHPMI